MGTNADEDPQEKLTGYGCVRRVHILNDGTQLPQLSKFQVAFA